MCEQCKHAVALNCFHLLSNFANYGSWPVCLFIILSTYFAFFLRYAFTAENACDPSFSLLQMSDARLRRYEDVHVKHVIIMHVEQGVLACIYVYTVKC